MNILILIIANLCILQGAVLNAQEPFTYQAKDFKKSDLPKGMTAEQYMQQVYQERHYKIKVTFRVVDESGAPVSDADIDVGIDSLLHADGYNNYKGKTDAKGLFTVESRGRGCNQVEVKKKGYYESRPEVKWDGDLNPGGKIMHKNGGFRPWNPTIDVVLRKIGKPIPMRVWLSGTDGSHRSLGLGKEFGFDLFEKDWVKPHGRGKRADLLIKFDSEFKNQNDFKTECSIRFANPDDGFIAIPELVSNESRLKYPREAPANGYTLKTLLIEKDSSGGQARRGAKIKEPKGYIVRFRTLKNPKTKEMLAAYYGKITAPQELAGNVNPFELHTLDRVDRKLVLAPRFRFSFYVNPTPNDRNLEYDQKNNLAPDAPKGLSWPP